MLKGFKSESEILHKPRNLLDFSTLTILTRCPGVAVMSQVHSLRLGYLSGQLGLLRVPLGLWILCSHSAGHTHTHTRKHTDREEVKIMAAQEKVRGNGKGTGRRETRELKEREEDFKETHPDNKFSERVHTCLKHCDSKPSALCGDGE